MKKFHLTETGKAEIGAIDTCPICGACSDSDTSTWDFVSNCWNKAPLLCEHGYRFTENMNTTDDAANDDWQDSVLIFAEFIPELEALGYKEEVEEEAPDPLAAALDQIIRDDPVAAALQRLIRDENIHPAFRDGLRGLSL